MERVKKALLKLVLPLGIFLPALASARDIYPTTSPQGEVPTGGAALGLGVIVLIFLIWLVVIAVGLFFLILWIVMLVDCIKRDFPERGMWLAILIISFFLGLSWLVAIIYYFVVKKKYGPITSSAPQKPQESQETQGPPQQQ